MITAQPFQPQDWLQQLTLPAPNSHKGQNGKLLIIGGSALFHAASKWSLDVASKLVDMVFYASLPSNNQLIQTAKGEFWNGIVIELAQIHEYIQEADAVLIGPGMVREAATADLTNQLLRRYPTKKWVIDAGALQMVEPALLTATTIITPHHQELTRLSESFSPATKITPAAWTTATEAAIYFTQHNLAQFPGILVCKGPHDFILHQEKLWEIPGGNAGMTKGGTGDVLAGLIAGLYCKHDALTAAIVGSYANKLAGDVLYQQVGPFFNTSDLVAAIPQALWGAITNLEKPTAQTPPPPATSA